MLTANIRFSITIFEWQHISQVQLTNLVDKPLDQYVLVYLSYFEYIFSDA
jgi:hypothetical protein